MVARAYEMKWTDIWDVVVQSPYLYLKNPERMIIESMEGKSTVTFTSPIQHNYSLGTGS